MYILILTIISSVGVHTSTSEFRSRQTCEQAAKHHIAQIEKNTTRSISIGATCNPKGLL